MKAVILMLLSVLPAVGLEGTVWYDSAGNVAWVDGPAAAQREASFVPGWEQRENERRERMARPRYGRDRFDRDGISPWEYGVVRSWGGSLVVPGGGCVPRPIRCLPPVRTHSPGVSVIIRR